MVYFLSGAPNALLALWIIVTDRPDSAEAVAYVAEAYAKRMPNAGA